VLSEGGPWAALESRRARPLLLVLSGPSGAGKSSLIARFLSETPGFVESVSATTRAPRDGEQDGVDYHFLSEELFARRVEAGEFLEYAHVFGKYWYGTPRAFVDEQFAEGRSVIMDIDVQGAAQIRERMPEAVLIFVVPPSAEALEQRLRGRGTEAVDELAARLGEAERELAQWPDFDYVVVNDELEHAVRDLEQIVDAERLRRPKA